MGRRRATIQWSDVEALEADLRRELPRFAVCYKNESPLQRFIGKLVYPFCRTYGTNYTTAMSGRVYFPSRAFCERQGAATVYATLRHEAVHLRDARRFPVLFQLSYLLLLPAVFTTRAIWEWRAYKETLRVELELYGEIGDRVIEHIARRFTGPDYLFMCPFPRFVRRRLLRARERLAATGSAAR